MFTIKTLFSRYSFPTILKPPINPNGFSKSWPISFATQRLVSVTAQLETPTSSKSVKTTQNGNFKTKNKKPLDTLFKEALGLIDRGEDIDNGSEENGEEHVELKKKLWDLEMELRQLKAKYKERENKLGGKNKSKRLSALFDDMGEESENLVEKKDGLVLKEISRDMELLLKHLYEKGYFKDVNFLPGNSFDVCYFDGVYARDFVKFAVERFGQDHQEITKWLSGSDLKTLAQFGCPSLEKREVFAAKRLRIFFEIPEETVCSKCSLKESCKFVNQSIWGKQNQNLRLDLLMRLLRTYSLEHIPSPLKLTEELEACVNRLIHEIINLSKSS